MSKLSKLFVVADIQGDYAALVFNLKSAGFEEDNPNHLIVSLGNTLNGEQSKKVIEFLSRSDLDKRIFLIKGEQEITLEKMYKRQLPIGEDWRNGNMNLVLSIAPIVDNWELLMKQASQITNPITKKMNKYYETENYIFCCEIKDIAELYSEEKANKTIVVKKKEEILTEEEQLIEKKSKTIVVKRGEVLVLSENI